MKNLFLDAGINLTEEQLKKFEKYYEILVSYNQKVNVTAITEKEEIYVKHFVDSVINVDKLVGKTLIDVGSGGGFPGIPIKILRDDLSVTLLEATGKKCDFLNIVIKEIELKDIKVVNARAEDLSKTAEFREQFDICTARAVARLNSLCEYVMPFTKVDGCFVAYKTGEKEEIKEAENAIKTLGGKLDKILEYDLFGNKRSMIFIKKIKNTDKKYPRGNGKERKCPL